MGDITSPQAFYGLRAIGTPTKTQVSDDVQIGLSTQTLNLTGATKAYCVSATLATAGDTLTIDTETGIATIGSGDDPVAQVETATAAGTIGTSGNAAVVVTGARITGSPVTLAVAVTSGDTASVWAGKVRTALNANTAITSKYTVGGSTTAITLTEIDPQNNDATLNISLDNGTCTGITTAATSANTTAGVGGVKLTNNTGDGKDFEGVSLGTMNLVSGFLIVNSGAGAVEINIGGSDYFTYLEGGGTVASVFDPAGTSDFIGTLTITAVSDAVAIAITIIAQTA